MSASVKLAGRLPGEEEVNGVDVQQGSLVDDPSRLRFGIVTYRTLKITTNVELDTEIPTIEIVRFEPVGDSKTVPEAIRAELVKSAQLRLNKTPLPFDEVDPKKVTVTYDEDRDDPIDFGDDTEGADQ